VVRSGKKYNYCGPNTNLRKRLNPDKTPKDFSKPVNKVDDICMRYDINNNNNNRLYSTPDTPQAGVQRHHRYERCWSDRISCGQTSDPNLLVIGFEIAYEEADKGIGTRHDADKTMLNELNELNNKEFNWNEFLAKYFTNGGNRCTVQVRTGIRRSPRIAQANET